MNGVQTLSASRGPSRFASSDSRRWILVLPLREAVVALNAGTLPPRAVAITFDDGMHDFASAVVAALTRSSVLRNGFCHLVLRTEASAGVRVACRYLLWKGRGQSISGEGLTSKRGLLDLGSTIQRNAVRVCDGRPPLTSWRRRRRRNGNHCDAWPRGLTRISIGFSPIVSCRSCRLTRSVRYPRTWWRCSCTRTGTRSR